MSKMTETSARADTEQENHEVTSMKHIRRGWIGCLLAAVLLALPIMPARAEGTTVIAVSDASLEVGDTLTVTVRPSEDGTITLAYNTGVLRLQDCDISGYTTDGGRITYTGGTARITFEAVSSGSSALRVSSDTLTGSSTSIQVADPASQQETQQDPGTSSTQPEGQFQIDGVDYVASERFTDREIPAGFSRVEVDVQGSSYTEVSNGQITLIYLKPASNIAGSGTFYIYNVTDQTVAPLVLVGSLQDYVIQMTPEEVPARLAAATVTIGEQQVSAYQVSGGEESFCYLYGMDETGSVQWYEYDSADGSVQRANMTLLTQEETEDTTEQTPVRNNDSREQISMLRIGIAALIFVVAVLAIVIINMVLSRRRAREEFDFADDDDMESEEAEDTEDIRGLEYAEDEEDAAEFYEKDTPEIRAMFAEDEAGESDAEDAEEPGWTSDEENGDTVDVALTETETLGEISEEEFAKGIQRDLDQLNLEETDEVFEEGAPKENVNRVAGKKEKKGGISGKKDPVEEEEEVDFSDLEILDLNDL